MYIVGSVAPMPLPSSVRSGQCAADRGEPVNGGGAHLLVLRLDAEEGRLPQQALSVATRLDRATAAGGDQGSGDADRQLMTVRASVALVLRRYLGTAIVSVRQFPRDALAFGQLGRERGHR